MKKDFDYYKFKQLEAVSSILFQTESYFYRKVCRWYSKEFCTPLDQVHNISWDIILTHYYESNLERIDYNDVYDLAIDSFLPEVKDEEEKENQEFADRLVEEQEKTLKRKAKPQSLQEDLQEPSKDIPKIPPINLNFEEDL